MIGKENLSRCAGDVEGARAPRVSVSRPPMANFCTGPDKVRCGTRHPHPPRFASSTSLSRRAREV
jgi:hypothetical protein